MGMQENWNLFIETTKRKSKSHSKAAQYWNNINNVMCLTLIVLGAVTTFMALIKSIPTELVAGVACVSTLLSAVLAFLKPADRRQVQTAASRNFQELMLQMVRCETEEEYEDLWRDLNKCVVDAPFLPKKFASDVDIEWTITPELLEIVRLKEDTQNKEILSSCQDEPLTPVTKSNSYGAIDHNCQPNLNPNFENDETLELIAHTSS